MAIQMENDPRNHGFCICILEWSEKAIFCESSIDFTGAYYKNQLKSICYQLAENCTLPCTTSMMEHGHTSLKQYNCLWMETGRRFVTNDLWPPYSPDLNPLDFLFWTQVKRKVYEGKLTPFKNFDEFKRKIKSVWQHVAKLLWPANYLASHTAV